MIAVIRVISCVLFAAVWLTGICEEASAQGCTGTQMLTAKSCAGDDASPEDKALFDLVNKYRTANGKPALNLSAPLSTLANRRVLDMRVNMKSLTHSWSNCPYALGDQKTWSCMLDSPKRLNTGYGGQGYETLYRTGTGKADPNQAMQAWQKSTLHNSIILNSGMFKDMAWDALGVAIDGEYAVLWFGHPGAGSSATAPGLGITYEQAVAGLSRILAVTAAPSGSEVSKWQGTSADKKIKLEIYGTRKDISEASIAVSMQLEGGKLSPQAKTALSTLLKNLFPDWTDRDAWLTSAVTAIGSDPSSSKAKVLPKAQVEISARGGSLRLVVSPGGKPRYLEL